MNRLRQSHALPWVLLLAAGIPWGATFTLTIIALERGDHPLGIAFWQTVAGVVILLFVNAARGMPVPPISRHHAIFYVACGILGTALPTVLFLYAGEHVQAGVLSLSTAMVPMLTFAIAFAIRMERFEIVRLTGLGLGCLAIVMITVPETGLPDPNDWIWVLVTVIAAASYSVENVAIAKYIPAGDPFVILTGMQIAAAFMLLAIAFQFDAMLTPAWPFERVDWAILAMGAVNVFAYGLFIVLINMSGPVFASQMGYVVTLAGVGWGIVWLGESHSLWFWGALAAMIAGLMLVQPRKRADQAMLTVAHPGDHLVDQAVTDDTRPDD